MVSPKYFRPNKFWAQIAEEASYITKSPKASHIQNLVFRYIHKVMAQTMFARRDNTWFTTLKELYLFHAMVNGYSVNVVVVLAKQLSRVTNSPTRGILIGGFITPSLSMWVSLYVSTLGPLSWVVML